MFADAFNNLRDPVKSVSPPEPKISRLSQVPRLPPRNPLASCQNKESQFNPEACLEALPNELKVTVMRELHTLLDLKCLLTSSNNFFRTFKALGAVETLDIVKDREKLTLVKEFVKLGVAKREV
jgi:hypothetical protein